MASDLRRAYARVLSDEILKAACEDESVIRPVMKIMELWAMNEGELPIEEAFKLLAETVVYYDNLIKHKG